MSLIASLHATWPAASTTQIDAVTVPTGQGGGSHVSAARALGPVSAETLAQVEAAQRALGQPLLWQITDPALDAQLAAAGYGIKDPTVFMQAPVTAIAAQELGLMTAFRITEPLSIQREIWAAGGIGPARLAIMARAPGPKTTVMGRVEDQPAGTAFAALHESTAMVHAVEVLARFRRKGLARNMMIALARWAEEQGAETIALAVTEANVPARALYAAMGFEEAPGYHYRIREETP